MKPILLDLPMPIVTPRLLLRPWQVGDGAICNEAVNESFEALQRFMPWARNRPFLEESEEIVRQAAANWILKKCEEPWLPLFIFEKETHQLLGSTGFHNINWEVPCIETGYWVRTQYEGRGIITEAVNALVQYAFHELKVKRIAITCDVTNLRSQKIPKQLGFTLEATLKANRKDLLTQTVSDTLVFARYNLQGLPELKVEWGN